MADLKTVAADVIRRRILKTGMIETNRLVTSAGTSAWDSLIQNDSVCLGSVGRWRFVFGGSPNTGCATPRCADWLGRNSEAGNRRRAGDDNTRAACAPLSTASLRLRFSLSRRFSLIRRSFVSLTLVFGVVASTAGSEIDPRGSQFIGWRSVSSFTTTPGSRPGEIVLTSPEIIARIDWNELVASWNTANSADNQLTVEVRAIHPDHTTKYYTLGRWSSDPVRHPRESVLHQKDDDGDVATDTLVLKRPCRRLQIRLTLGSSTRPKSTLKFLGLNLFNSSVAPPALPPNRAAWGKSLPVTERSQMVYPDGKELCSPTTVSMLMAYWAQKLKRPELDRGVPNVAKEVYDPNWPGTGNWPFNTAYAGSFPGMRAYVTRFSDVSELEDWIARGIPVGVSVSYDLLRGKAEAGNGHLIVCVGFTKEGDVIVNDPGTTLNVRKTFPRKNLIAAWAYSHNTVYLIYPTNARIPTDRFGHWNSKTSRQRIEYQKRR